MGITVKRTGKPYKFDPTKAEKLIRAYVPGAILRRTDKGISSTGNAFAPYSPSYREALAKGGEAAGVDLRLTGGLMNSIKVTEVHRTSDGVTIIVAPDAGTSPAVSLGDGTARRTGRRGPPHNALAYWIETGTPTMPPRPFLALTAEEARTLGIMLDRAKLFG